VRLDDTHAHDGGGMGKYFPAPIRRWAALTTSADSVFEA